MQSLLQLKPLTVPDETRASNSLNGSDAETLAATLLVNACRGEISWGSREEDNNKIDLILSYQHPWIKSERIMILSQVKSGATYGEVVGSGFKLKLAAIKAAKRTSHSICTLWVDRDLNTVYWAYIHPNSKTATQEYGAYHKVCPATLFDLTRCMSRNGFGTTGGKGIIIRKRHSNVTIRRKTVKEIYKQMGTLYSPVIGNIELTRLAWRHMFRSSRSSNYKETSLDLIPYLNKIIKQHPTSHAITGHHTWENNGYIYRSTEHLLKFSEILISEKLVMGKKKAQAIIKVIEEIRYPENWITNAMLTQRVERRVVLKSAYYKI